MDDDDDFGDFEGPLQTVPGGLVADVSAGKAAVGASEAIPLEFFGDAISEATKGMMML